MLLGYNTNGLRDHRLEDALRLLADHGYQAVALTLDVGHLDPLRCTAAEVGAVAALLTQLGLEAVIETGARFVLDPWHKHEPTLMTRDPAARARRLDFYARCARIGADLGARTLSFWTGTDRGPERDRQAWLLEGVARTCEVVRAHGLVPALEPEPGMAVETCADYEAVAARLGREAPALCLDVGHLYVTGEGDPAQVIERHAARLRQVHLEDMRRGWHEHLPPGEGDVDFTAVRRALEHAGYRFAVCFELSRSSHAGPDMVRRCRAAWDAARPAFG
ncbi:MAG TPA: sugar phosphate isomerase/epimerase family protein [Planctomycetota bacterium]|nr:sugar phosphate isomerase/epimerase family protein [Planctomycetota bacterium]